MAEFVEANWQIPYCEFSRTENGFAVSFTKDKDVSPAMMALLVLGGIAAVLFTIIISVVVGFNSGAGGGFLTFLILIGGMIWLYVSNSKVTTRIMVTKNGIVIDGEVFRRDDFAGFNISKTVTNGPHRFSVVGYRYGNVSLPIGGLWKENEAADFTAALNVYFRNTLQAGDETGASPQALRAARPTDF